MCSMGLRPGVLVSTEPKKDREVVIMGINTPNKNRTDQSTANQKLIDGLNKHAATIPSIVIAGASVTTKDIIATLQSRIDSAKAAQSTRATWQTAVQADHAERDKTKTFVSGLKQALLVAFVGQIDTLADFGLTGRKVRVVSPEEKVAAAAKAKATRAARHTMGKVQKAAIKGTVTPTAPATATPSASTPIPTPPAAPAPTPVSPAPTQAAPAPTPASPAPTQVAPVTPVTPPAPTPPVTPVTTATATPPGTAPAPTSPGAAPATPVTPAHVG